MLRRFCRPGLALVIALMGPAACVRGKTQSVPPEMTWASWHVLEPLMRDAQYAVDETTFAAMIEAATLLDQQKARSADAALAKVEAGSAPHWVAVARADLAALHFERCIRGVAWRLSDGPVESRAIDFEPGTSIDPADVSVESMLTKLDGAVEASRRDAQGNLNMHARIARARVTSFVMRCAPNEDVAQQADEVMRSDLATLAAEDSLPPDLAYVWAGIQYELYSPQAARPFLLAAKEEGFEDPSVDLLLAAIAIDGRDFVEAQMRAETALTAYREAGVREFEAQALSTRGEARRGLEQWDAALADFRAALEIDPWTVEAILGAARVELARGDRQAAQRRIREGVLSLMSDDAEDLETLADAAARVEALIIALNGELAMAELARDALLHEVDLDAAPFRRALRYYFAATLEVALGDYEAARGHAAAAEAEFTGEGLEAPDGVQLMLERLGQMMG